MTTPVASVLMAAQRCCPAYLDGTHDEQMTARHGVRFSIPRTVQTKDIRQFDAVRRPHQDDNYVVCSEIMSRGLVTCDRFIRLTCRYTVVVVGDLWPKSSWTW